MSQIKAELQEWMGSDCSIAMSAWTSSKTRIETEGKREPEIKRIIDQEVDSHFMAANILSNFDDRDAIDDHAQLLVACTSVAASCGWFRWLMTTRAPACESFSAIARPSAAVCTWNPWALRYWSSRSRRRRSWRTTAAAAALPPWRQPCRRRLD